MALAAAARAGPVGAGARGGALAVLLRVFMWEPALLSSLLLVLLGLLGELRSACTIDCAATPSTCSTGGP